jgi:hypothetical protein
VSVQPVNGAWTELGVTYQTLPPLGTVVTGQSVRATGKFVTLDVTGVVQQWVSGSVQFDRKENDEAAHATTLDIALVGSSSGTTGSVGATGATGVTGAQEIQGLSGAFVYAGGRMTRR